MPPVPSQAGLDFQGALHGESWAKPAVPITALKIKAGPGHKSRPPEAQFLAHVGDVQSHLEKTT